MTLYVGTSGWAYKEWKPDFYPADIPQTRFLEFYSRIFTACEINATFYGLQKPATFTKWAEATPESFRFACKVHRGLTHGKTIAPTDEKLGLLSAFLESVRTLGDRLGVLLFQFPPYRKRDDAGLVELMAFLPPDINCAFEFRDPSWDDAEVRAAVAGAGRAICISDTAGTPPGILPEGPLGYVRLRTDRYDDEGRSGWEKLLVSDAHDRNVFAFAKHEGIPPGDPYGGVGLARWLVGRVESPEGRPD